jgi:hypothetical protein
VDAPVWQTILQTMTPRKLLQRIFEVADVGTPADVLFIVRVAQIHYHGKNKDFLQALTGVQAQCEGTGVVPGPVGDAGQTHQKLAPGEKEICTGI